MLRHFRSHAAARRHRLRLDAERAHARARGRGEVGQPVAREGVPRRGVPRAVRVGLRLRRAATACSTRASCGCTSWRSRRAGTRVHPRLGITKRFYDWFTPAIPRSDFALRDRAARPRARLRRGAPRMSERRGALALVLHTHMPYVEGFGTWPFGEEWLWEAVASVYLPLLDVLEGAPVTVGLTPVLCDQLEAMRGEAGDRYLRFLREIRAPIHAEDSAGLDATAASPSSPPSCAARRATTCAPTRRSSAAAATCSARSRGLGRRELWTSAATHAVLPLLATDAGLRLQVGAGVAVARAPLRRLERRASGCPSARTSPGSSATSPSTACACSASTRPTALGLGSLDHLEPVATDAGPGRGADRLADGRARLGERDGLPVARRLPRLPRPHAARPAAVERTAASRTTTTAALGARPRARARLRRRARRLDAHAASAAGLVCCALDTELLGHWWYEGPEWLAAVLAEAAARGARPGHAARRRSSAFEPVERELAASTWGSPQGPLDLGLAARRRGRVRRPRAPSSHRRGRRRGPGAAAALERAARELLALQSSDWAFLLTRELAADYPLRARRGAPRGARRRPGRSDRLRARAGPGAAPPRAGPRPGAARSP